VIRFSAFLVAVALGLLVAGVVTSKLALVYVAIGVSGVALLALGVGALLKRNELFGQPKSAQSISTGPGLAEPELARQESAAVNAPAAQSDSHVTPWEAPVPAASAWTAATPPAPSRAGYLPTDQPLPTQPHQPAGFAPPSPTGSPPSAPGVPSPASDAWAGGTDAPPTQPFRRAESSPPSVPEPAMPSQPPAESTPPAGSAPAAQDELPALAEQPTEEDLAQPPDKQGPPAGSQPSAGDQPAAEDQPQDAPSAGDRTQQLPTAVIAAAEPAAAEPAASEPAASEPSASEPSASESAVDLQREVTVVPGVPRYHNPHCLLIRFMGQDDLDKMTLGAARDRGLTPCRACLPDQPEEITTS
jgi:hypothetical protein